MNTPEHVIPELTIGLLQELCSLARSYLGTSSLIIAGGAPRDVLHGTPVKDIDIFVQVTPDDLALPTTEFGAFNYDTDTFVAPSEPALSSFQQRCTNFARALNGGTAEFRQSPEAYGGLADLCDIKTNSYPVQIIALFEDPIDDVHGYDFGLSQVFVTPRGVFFTKAFQEDSDNYTITYIDGDRSEAAVERSRKRLARLREKYGTFRFVGTEALDDGPSEVL